MIIIFVQSLVQDPAVPPGAAGSSSLLNAAEWTQGTMLGTVATTVAIVAVAATGVLMFSGQINVRRGLTVVVGCFILFGASSIAAGLQSLTGKVVERPIPILFEPSEPTTPMRPPPPRVPAEPYDPYAGASVPQR
ncbi:TrbC/VirB2 family protein [Sphingomonas sp. PB4P5]|uniref:TrbC/VirB2 family protein n=1 Tax=Parasphingomonas puruogangriensis TaxID=3096155 RepID=UPI002FC58BEA